jgi:hypothetical protein
VALTTLAETVEPVKVSHLRDWVRPDQIKRRSVPWGIGCTPRELAPDWAEPNDPLVGCSRNGGLVFDWDVQLQPGDHVHYWARPGFQVALASQLLVTLGNALLFTAYGIIINRLLAKKPASPGDESSPTYAFTNLQRNVRGDGVPIPVVYGRHRFAPPIVNEYIRSSIDQDGNPSSEYLALYLIGEGPVQSIGGKTVDGGPFSTEAGTALVGLEINNQPASNFAGVEAHVRLGTAEQTAIAEFADAVLSYDVDKTLRDSDTLTHATTANDVPSATTAIATAGVFPAANTNVTKWDAQQSYTSGDDADEFTAVLEFPAGLIKYNSTGNALSNTVIYQARYRQVDGGGVPFGDYIVLGAESRTLTRAGLLRLEYRKRLYSTTGYGAPLNGRYAQSRATGSTHPGIAHVVSTSFVPAAPASLQVTVIAWLQLRNIVPDNVNRRVWEWFDAAGNEGLRCRFLTSSTSNTSAVDLDIGTGTATQSVGLLSGSSSEQFRDNITTFQQLAVTYEASAEGVNTRVRVYLDGVLRRTVITAHRAQLDPTQPIRFLSDSPSAPTVGLDAHLDDVAVFSRALTPYEIAANYNGGAPLTTDPTATGLIVSGTFDADAGSSPNIGALAFGPFVGLNMGTFGTWIYGTGTGSGVATNPITSSAAGIVKANEVGIPQRGKYLVEIMRLDTEDTTTLAQSEVAFKSIQLRTFDGSTFPGMALLAVKIPANDQLSGGAPLVSTPVEGRLVPVWDGVDAIYPNMPAAYSRNPAWVAADIALNQDYGLGAVYRERDIDAAQFQAFADWCGALIYDNQDRATLQEARYLDSAAEAVTISGTNLGTTYGDVVRYKVASLPTNFPATTSTPPGKYLKPILTGLSPAPPTWLTNQAALTAQEVLFVEYSAGSFYVYTRTTQTLGAGQTTYTVTSGAAATNGPEIHDVRMRFDGIFDRAGVSAWDALTDTLKTARAAPLRLGSRLSVFYDDLAEPVGLVGMGNIIAGSWKQGFLGIGDRPNAESAEIFAEELNWERTPVSDEHPDVTDPAQQTSHRWRRIKVEGITRRGQAKRYIRRDLNVYNLVRSWCEFELGIDALPFQPGDVLAVSHDVPQYGYSGRIYADSTNTTVRLDRAITLTTGWQVQVEDAATGLRYTVAVTHGAGTYAANTPLTVAAFPSSFIPAKNDKYAIGETSRGETKKFRLVESTFAPKSLRRRCRCVEYDAQVYSDNFGTLPNVSASALPVPTAPSVPAGVENLTASEVTVRGPDGSVSTTARVEFSHITETYSAVGGADVYVSADGAGFGAAEHVAHLDARSVTVTLTYPFAAGRTYTIWVMPRTRDGSGAYRAFASWVPFSPRGLAPTPAAPTNVRASVSGESAAYAWDDAGDLDMGATVEARRGGWLLGLPVFAVPSQSRASGPTLAWADAPANAYGAGSPDLVLRAKLRTGQYSPAVTVTPSLAPVGSSGQALSTSEEDSGWT